MTVAIDFDGTIMRGPDFDYAECSMWVKIARAFQNHDHRVIIVTMRPHGLRRNHTMPYAERMKVEVVFCGGFPDKRTALREFGVSVDLWIDDMPDTIGSLPLISIADPEADSG